MMVETQWYRLSPLGPAEQSARGSTFNSCISFWILFPEDDTEVVGGQPRTPTPPMPLLPPPPIPPPLPAPEGRPLVGVEDIIFHNCNQLKRGKNWEQKTLRICLGFVGC